MNELTRGLRRIATTALILVAVLSGPRPASAQHVTAAMAATMAMPGRSGNACEGRARQAAAMLDALNARLERGRQTTNEAETRSAVDEVKRSLAELTRRLDACRAGDASSGQRGSPPAPGASVGGGMAGMDHAKMDTGGGKPSATTPQTGSGGMAGMDHSKMAMGQAGAAAVPTTVRQISGPAEAALQSFQDALQIGNREVALEWLAPDATITEAGVTDRSREAYANGHMGVDMAFLKTAKVMLLDRQVQSGGDSARIVSNSRVTGRADEMPVDVTVRESAVLQRTPRGWRVVSLEWSVAPAPAELTDSRASPRETPSSRSRRHAAFASIRQGEGRPCGSSRLARLWHRTA